jgi:hypothetical protein
MHELSQRNSDRNAMLGTSVHPMQSCHQPCLTTTTSTTASAAVTILRQQRLQATPTCMSVHCLIQPHFRRTTTQISTAISRSHHHHHSHCHSLHPLIIVMGTAVAAATRCTINPSTYSFNGWQCTGPDLTFIPILLAAAQWHKNFLSLLSDLPSRLCAKGVEAS